jgi:hypothetical protein
LPALTMSRRKKRTQRSYTTTEPFKDLLPILDQVKWEYLRYKDDPVYEMLARMGEGLWRD